YKIMSNFHINTASFFLNSYGYPPDLHSFPTRRSSDLASLNFKRWETIVTLQRRRSHCPGRRRKRRERHHTVRRVADRPIVEIGRSEEHTSELQSPCNLVCRLLLEKKKKKKNKRNRKIKKTKKITSQIKKKNH